MEIPASFREGDHAVFIEVYKLFHARLFRWFLKRVYFHDTAMDLTQQSFMRLWQYRESLSLDHELEKRVFIVGRSVLINHLKKEATQKKLKAEAGRHLPVGSEPVNDLYQERAGEVNAAIQTLPSVRKRVITLKAFHGFSNKEIAQQLHISVKTVEDHVTKAFRHIRQVVALF
ncbi:MAG TPA: sigma-70 family RNA polymerase sigma factor [Puia sp.]|uniref:RNA polymerase sigma factor n=1 Tax=Puia sp. TaxID=2045100 RepID=UPI002C9B7EDC|nr:sigma-70 family RNA polymerase sigma factor [Puia sp.]HVU95190.1 sigma-70 family RNA polymerase sigma factor [Puia sp.]